MPYVIVTIILTTLAIYIVPVAASATEKIPPFSRLFCFARHHPPGSFSKFGDCYALQMATFGPFFLWGAAGDFWPAVRRQDCATNQ